MFQPHWKEPADLNYLQELKSSIGKICYCREISAGAEKRTLRTLESLSFQ